MAHHLLLPLFLPAAIGSDSKGIDDGSGSDKDVVDAVSRIALGIKGVVCTILRKTYFGRGRAILQYTRFGEESIEVIVMRHIEITR